MIEECIYYEEAIRNLEAICANSIYWNTLGYSKMIENYKTLLEKTKEELELMETLLEELREKEALSAQFFVEVFPLLREVEKAINDAEFYINGTGNLSDGSWKINIPDTVVKYLFKYNWRREDLPNCEIVTVEFMNKVIDISDKLEINPVYKFCNHSIK